MLRPAMKLLCQELEMTPATVSRLLGILKKQRFVHKNMDRKYELGEIFIDFGKSINESRRASQLAIIKPHLMHLNNILNENIHLEVLSGNDIKIATVLSGSKAVKVAAEPDIAVGVNATAGSKVILAFLPPERLDNIMRAHPILRRFRPNTITDWNELKRQFKEIRKSGLAYDFDEHLEDIHAVGTPIFDYSGMVTGAVSIIVPSYRTTIISKQNTKNLLKDTARKITANLRDFSSL